MTAQEVIRQLHTLADPATQKTFDRHGANGTSLGVKVGDLKALRKKIKTDQALALELYESGISDAMYLAGLIADPKAMTAAQLRDWAGQAPWSMIAEYTVPWVAAESAHGWALALEWIESDHESIAAAGWATLAGVVVLRPDGELDKDMLRDLLNVVENEIGRAQNRVRYNMNGFVMALGIGVADLTEAAKAAAARIGPVHVAMGDTACKVPDAAAYIRRAEESGAVGKKRKTVRC